MFVEVHERGSNAHIFEAFHIVISLISLSSTFTPFKIDTR